MSSGLYQAFIYLLAAIVAVPLAKRLGLGSVIGYLLAGAVSQPGGSAAKISRATPLAHFLFRSTSRNVKTSTLFMNRTLLLASLLLTPLAAFAADPTPKPPLAPADNLVIDGVPPIPGELPEQVGRYTESRAAGVQDWHPTRAEMLITTRFGDTSQIHQVAQPGGARTQLTFFPDRVEGGSFEPTKGEYFVFTKGTGGAEFFQNYRYDLATGEITLLTDGKSRNSGPRWSNKGDRIAYTSTRRNGADTDIYVQSPTDPKTDRLAAEVKGGGWDITDWSSDDKQLLVIEFVSVNESYL
ncbi:MAG: hypothetical protein LC627_04470, partial [Verrucomicrobiaceae bacterium]|nr:hypothetical protein [Verrucomicrobiaceae bacterium]